MPMMLFDTQRLGLAFTYGPLCIKSVGKLALHNWLACVTIIVTVKGGMSHTMECMFVNSSCDCLSARQSEMQLLQCLCRARLPPGV